MDKVQNLHSAEAIKKLKEISESVRVCLFFTHRLQDEQGSPMTVAEVDEMGTIWFISSKKAAKTGTIGSASGDVHLVFSHPGKDLYLDLYGSAELSTSKSRIDELWNPLAKAWFPQGKEDPDICLIAVKPRRANYWDTQHGKMVEFLKIISAAISGNKEGDGISGKLELSR